MKEIQTVINTQHEILDFYDQLKDIIENYDPNTWPNAEWVFDELTKILYPQTTH